MSKRLRRIEQAQLFSPDIPVPRLDPDPGIRILERLVLQPARLKPQRAAQLEQPFLVGAYQVDHRLFPDLVPVKPNAAVQGESHPLTAALEFTIRRLRGHGNRPPQSLRGTNPPAAPHTPHPRALRQRGAPP